MYNRYIPQPDGSYRRNRVEEPPRPIPTPEIPTPPQPCPEEIPEEQPIQHRHPEKEEPHRHQSAGNFLRQLLPQNFDTGDLIVIILLLLIAGDCAESRSNAILTLALYFIM